MTVEQADLQWWLQLAPTLNWRFARTSDFPHSYIVKGKDLSDNNFQQAVRVIRTFGQPSRFFQWTHLYLINDNTKWWTMGAPVEETTIINTAMVEESFGQQDAPRTETGAFTVYDQIATEYDGLYTSPEDLAENLLVRSIIREHFGASAPDTLDVGCGTGLLLDLGVVSTRLYTGIDPSRGMLNQLVAKHPRVAEIRPGTAAEVLPEYVAKGRHFDLVCALFGAASYMTPDDWQMMLDLSRNLTVFMTLREGYLPSYWQGEERQRMLVCAEARRLQMAELAEAHHGSMRIHLANEDITVIRR